ncbi:hypothetical protein AAFF_G00162610 [Aldrovandia affinis]|uniref:Uncharacterized protein n=1 Tax=Aldrovandia affinis TaxID=143900 RepID=A0AAD7SZU8_9TELE|nr:hypothetical protein AAFF_G00162610 [Aldrovandia affinis]
MLLVSVTYVSAKRLICLVPKPLHVRPNRGRDQWSGEPLGFLTGLSAECRMTFPHPPSPAPLRLQHSHHSCAKPGPRVRPEISHLSEGRALLCHRRSFISTLPCSPASSGYVGENLIYLYV